MPQPSEALKYYDAYDNPARVSRERAKLDGKNNRGEVDTKRLSGTDFLQRVKGDNGEDRVLGKVITDPDEFIREYMAQLYLHIFTTHLELDKTEPLPELLFHDKSDQPRSVENGDVVILFPVITGTTLSERMGWGRIRSWLRERFCSFTKRTTQAVQNFGGYGQAIAFKLITDDPSVHSGNFMVINNTAVVRIDAGASRRGFRGKVTIHTNEVVELHHDRIGLWDPTDYISCFGGLLTFSKPHKQYLRNLLKVKAVRVTASCHAKQILQKLKNLDAREKIVTAMTKKLEDMQINHEQYGLEEGTLAKVFGTAELAEETTKEVAARRAAEGLVQLSETQLTALALSASARELKNFNSDNLNDGTKNLINHCQENVFQYNLRYTQHKKYSKRPRSQNAVRNGKLRDFLEFEMSRMKNPYMNQAVRKKIKAYSSLLNQLKLPGCNLIEVLINLQTVASKHTSVLAFLYHKPPQSQINLEKLKKDFPKEIANVELYNFPSIKAEESSNLARQLRYPSSVDSQTDNQDNQDNFAAEKLEKLESARQRQSHPFRLWCAWGGRGRRPPDKRESPERESPE